MPSTQPNPSLREIGDLIESASRIAIASHTKPDGDAIGSLLGLAEPLRALGKNVYALNQDGVPANYQFLEGWKLIQQPTAPLEVDLFVALDTGNRERIGDNVWENVQFQQSIAIDHHVSNGRYCDINYVDVESPSTGQLIYELTRTCEWQLTAVARDALWVAMVTDTGSWQYSNTGARSFEIAADLVREGVDVAEMARLIYQNYPLRRQELLRDLLNSMELSCDGKVASWKLTQETKHRLGIQPGDTEGLIDNLRSIQGVIVAIAFEEMKNGMTGISSRSKSHEVNVAQICSRFGGGGHHLAAGARCEGDIDSVASRFIQTVTDVITNGQQPD